MKILHVVPTYVPAWRYGGPIVSVHGLCKGLVRRGHELDVYTTNVDGDGALDVPVARPVDVDGVSVSYFACDGVRRLFWASGLRAALQRTAAGFDVIHAHSCFLLPPTWAARAARRAGVPYVFSPRGMLVDELITQRSAWIKRAWIRFVDQRTLRDAAAVHVTSGREADDLLRVVPTVNRFRVVANGVDAFSTPKPAKSTGGPRILFLGRVSWKKGIDLAIRMLAQIPVGRLRVVGNDEEGLCPALQQLAKSLGVSSRVDWLGPLYGEEKLRELAAADVFVLPSVSENFGNSVLESLAFGLPVVCSPSVGASALVAESGCGLVVERTPEAYALAVSRILADPIVRLQMEEAGRSLALRYSWDVKAAEMEQLYLDCLRLGSLPA